MKLQSQTSRKYRDAEYKKSWIVISNKLLKLLSWKTGQELDAEVKEGKLIIEKKKN